MIHINDNIQYHPDQDLIYQGPILSDKPTDKRYCKKCGHKLASVNSGPYCFLHAEPKIMSLYLRDPNTGKRL